MRAGFFLISRGILELVLPFFCPLCGISEPASPSTLTAACLSFMMGQASCRFCRYNEIGLCVKLVEWRAESIQPNLLTQETDTMADNVMMPWQLVA